RISHGRGLAQRRVALRDHHVFYPKGELTSQRPAGMEGTEILDPEPLPAEDGDRERVPHGGRGGGGRRGGEVERTRLLGDRAVEHDRGAPGQRGARLG